MSFAAFMRAKWRAFVGIWWPQVVAFAVAAFLFHRLSDCTNCIFGAITDPVIFNFKNNSAQDGSFMYVTAVLYVCMFMAAIVIFLSNLHFVVEVPIQALNQAALDFSRHQMSTYHKVAFYLTIVILIAVPIWAIKLMRGPEFLDLGPRGDEYIALSVFVLFCAIDALFLASCIITMRHIKELPGPDLANQIESRREDLRSLELTRRLFHDSLWYVDVPVVIGVSIVLLLSSFSENHFPSLGFTPRGTRMFGSIGAEQQESIFSIFVAGIAAGATVTHLVVSQFIFGFLRTRDLYHRAIR